MMRVQTLLLPLVFSGSIACSSSDDTVPAGEEPVVEDPYAGGEDVIDEDGNIVVTVDLPEPEEGTIDLVSEEAIVLPGEELMICQHMQYDGEDVGVIDVEMLQGRYGHHAVGVSTTDPKPPGTVEDCTDRSQMDKYGALFIPLKLADGQGLLLEGGQPFVLQSHYVNTADKPIRIRDVVRLRTKPAAEIQTWVSTFSASSLDYDIAPSTPIKQSFDCPIEEEVDLVVFGGHMHEYGSRYEIHYGSDVDNLERIYFVEDWEPEHRDSPPVEQIFENPVHLMPGDVVRTTCHWENPLDHNLGFPEEMCTTFGLIAGTQTHYDCRVGQDGVQVNEGL